ncbi:unnamed protein product [Meganyctiphanes norvegica]|uniref:EGF domain-specific O-linked N-acetylglucosamine transferase n=1 Tax=Meganyctiphanes norvegica TaxID=48144 RepID=A0AAV2QID2_MEGNR
MLAHILTTVHLLNLVSVTRTFNWRDIHLPPQHLPHFFHNKPHLVEMCRNSGDCPFKDQIEQRACWGYEADCSYPNAYGHPVCPHEYRGPIYSSWAYGFEVTNHAEQLYTFYHQADFGYVKKQQEELKVYCEPYHQDDSSLECSNSLRFCRGKNIFIDLRDLHHRQSAIVYDTDVLKPGQIGGHCRLNRGLLKDNLDEVGFLRSWAPELQNFEETTEQVARNTICDTWVDRPAYIVKIDATVNMYHHFCDFLNLFAAQHVNNTNDHSFSTDVQILIWRTSPDTSNFAPMWDAFTKWPVWSLEDVAGKRICFKQVVLPLLPRMSFGLFYNTPIVSGCERSGMFHAFSKHIIHRLGVPQPTVVGEKIHVTILSRETSYRNILNEGELIKALRENEDVVVRKVTYSHQLGFRKQLAHDQWTDIFVGMHGAGLTHLLFLPDWAVIFEIYNCDDPDCYYDLARLRGIKYMTWEDESKLTQQDEGHTHTLGAHKKFTNYTFDVKEFLRLIMKAVDHVKTHPGWLKLHSNKDEL